LRQINVVKQDGYGAVAHPTEARSTKSFLSRAFAHKTMRAIGVLLAVLAGGLMLVVPVQAAKSPNKSTAKPAKTLTVLAMIKAENDVLARWQAEQNRVALRARPKPSLLSIYGVLPQLRATVLVNGREVVFEQGRTRPLHPKKSSLRLRHIKPPCVSFVQGRRSRTLCLSRVGS